MANLNEIKIEGTIISKVNKVDLESGLKIANFILKTDGDHPIYILVKFTGKRYIELEKDQHVWLKGSLGNMRRKDGSFEIGINATAYKIHEDNQSPYPVKPNVEALDSIQVEEDSEPSGFKGVRNIRRKQK